MFTLKKLFIFSFLLLSLSLTACGKKAIVENISVKSSTNSEQDLLVTVDTQLNMGGLAFPSLSIPVANPRFPSETLAQVSVQHTSDGKNHLQFALNVTEAYNNRLNTDSLLPNGNLIPISGINNTVSIGLSSRSKLYVGGGDSSIVVGVALAIPLFDNIGQFIQNVDLFLPLPALSKIEGLAGVFTGSKGNSGIGVFLKVPNQVGFNSLNTLTANSQKAGSNLSSRSLAISTNSLTQANNVKFITSPTSQKTQSIENMLFNMSRQKRTMNIK